LKGISQRSFAFQCEVGRTFSAKRVLRVSTWVVANNDRRFTPPSGLAEDGLRFHRRATLNLIAGISPALGSLSVRAGVMMEEQREAGGMSLGGRPEKAGGGNSPVVGHMPSLAEQGVGKDLAKVARS
jgi:hypothetical protein